MNNVTLFQLNSCNFYSDQLTIKLPSLAYLTILNITPFVSHNTPFPSCLRPFFSLKRG